MKYVAFLDILGFKNKLRDLKQNRARSFIGNFSGTIFNIFNSQNFSDKINGYIVSDSLILYSNEAMIWMNPCDRRVERSSSRMAFSEM